MKIHKAHIRLIREYGKICMLGGAVGTLNKLTVHHLTPVRAGGKTILINLALVSRIQHDKFNVIEEESELMAKYLNEGMREYKETKDYRIIKELRTFTDTTSSELGYQVENTGKMLVLRRKI